MRFEPQILASCKRLAAKRILQSASDSFSARIPCQNRMLFATGLRNWERIEIHDLRSISLHETGDASAVHCAIYKTRTDAGAIALARTRGASLLVGFGGILPTLFDEQARHLGAPVGPVGSSTAGYEELNRALARGDNALLFGGHLLCLGMTCERVVFNTELFEKCAQAYAIARASGQRIHHIPWWVRLIAKRRLLKDEFRAARSFSVGLVPENIGGY